MPTKRRETGKIPHFVGDGAINVGSDSGTESESGIALSDTKR
ncbi:hypothetical protein SAMN04488133_3628 [Halobellus limi]|uniref:Uncharacterized protein n=1 Tax=Halobellus limi TaxID=699433 RepID=A0A1H6CPX7_9EURY|nr:hypothetical protein SAMN04488133_3628 [Halobellus limi]